MSGQDLLWTLPLVALGGAGGALVRHLVVGVASARSDGARAAAVAVCNLAGAVVLAVVVGAGRGGEWWVAAIVGTGFCGSLTTFSTWVVDGAATLQDGTRPPLAVLLVDLVGQLAAGVGLAWLVLRLV